MKNLFNPKSVDHEFTIYENWHVTCSECGEEYNTLTQLNSCPHRVRNTTCRKCGEEYNLGTQTIHCPHSKLF